jgi:hypothetical protein
MKKDIREITSAALMTVFTMATLLITGCGNSDIAKGLTDAVKKSIEGEVAKKGEDIKKQIDQVMNLGTGKNQGEGGNNAGGSGDSESGEGAGEEKD